MYKRQKDGYIAPKSKKEIKPIWITNYLSRQLVHKWRTEEQSILVGTNTVLEDNPSLTARDWKGNHPIRIIIDKENKLPKSLSVFSTDAETITINSQKVDFSSTPNIAKQICDILYENNINSVIIEGGSKTLQTFIDEGLWDEARVFTGNITLNAGTKSPEFNGKQSSEEKILNDTLKIYTLSLIHI